MKVLLTGSHGFIGSHYHHHVKEIFDVTCIDSLIGLDLCDPQVANSCPDCDIVIHMAATNGTRLFYESPTEVAFNNTLPTFNLINRYKNTKTKFVFTSTCEIFNGATDRGLHDIPTDEAVPVMFADIVNPRWSYSIPKALGENLISNCGLEWLTIRYFNIYGPRQKDHFISEFVKRAHKGEYYIKGNDTRSFCFIDDAIEMTHSLIINHSNEIVNIGRQEEVTIETVAKMIMDIMGVDPDKLEIQSSPKGSAIRRCPDTSKILKLTKFKHYTPLVDGLKKTINTLL